MFTKFKCCCLLIVCIPIIYGYTETAQSFSEQLRALYRTKNAKELQKRLMPLKQEKPVFDDLFGTETGDRYYALGKLLKSYYDDQDTDALCFFLQNGASGFIEDGEAPIVYSYLHYAIQQDNAKILERLMTAGAHADVYSEMGNKESDLSYAITCKAYRCLEALLRNGADPNKKIQIRFIGEPGSVTKNVLYDAREDAKALEILFRYGAKTGIIHTKALPEMKNGKEVTALYNTVLERKENRFIVREDVIYQ